MAISQILYPGPPPLVIDANSLASWTILRSRFLVPSSRLALRTRNRKCVATTANKPRQRRHGLRRCYERASLLPSCSSWYSAHERRRVMHVSRPVASPADGGIVAISQLGGLHHRYERRAA
jgi:hypothetical protein